MDRHPKDFKYNKDTSIGESVSYTICKGCEYSNEDIIVGGEVVYNGFNAGVCKKYVDGKPIDYANSKANCPYKS